MKKWQEMRFLFNYPTHAAVFVMAEYEPKGNSTWKFSPARAHVIQDREGKYWWVNYFMYTTNQRALDAFNDLEDSLTEITRIDLS